MYHIFDRVNDITRAFVFEIDDENEIMYYDNLACLSAKKNDFIVNHSNPVFIDESTFLSYLKILSDTDIEMRNKTKKLSKDQRAKLKYGIDLARRHYAMYLEECKNNERKQIKAQEYRIWKKERDVRRQKEKEAEEQRQKEKEERQQKEKEAKEQRRREYQHYQRLSLKYSGGIQCVSTRDIQYAYLDATEDYSNIYDT